MYSAHSDMVNTNDLFYDQTERTSDIQMPSVMNFLLFAVWVVICLIGLVVITLAKNPVAGAIIIAVPTFIGMVIKPTFALCIMMLVLPTGAGFAVGGKFTLDHGVGLAVAVSFALNLLITRPRLRIGNKALWCLILYTIWVCLASLAAPHLALEARRVLTHIQLLALIFIVYWILETNSVNTFHWALRAYVLGTLGTIIMAFATGAAIRSIGEETEARYAATLGQAIDANMLAALTAAAFLSAVYLLVRDKNLLLRIGYLVAIVFLPIMLLKIGSRGALVALAFTLFSPLLFIRQVLRRPAMAIVLLVVILLGSFSAGLLVRERGLETRVETRLTDIGLAQKALSYRMMAIKAAVKTAIVKPAGTSYYGWFEQAGMGHYPHADFFQALGIYGIPGAVLFATFVIMMLLTVKRIPLGPEKIFARALLTFFLVMGLNIGQLTHKHFWVFLIFVIASERVASFFLPVVSDDVVSDTDYEESMLPQHQLV